MNTKFDLRKRRLELGLTLEEVGNAVGVGKSTVRKWETGDIANMRRDKIAALAEILEISPVLLTKDGDVRSEAISIPTRRIPVLGTVPAGLPIEAIEDIVDWEELNMNDYHGGFEYVGIIVKGKSMEPNYLDGDTLIVRLQDTAETGNDAVVFVNGDDATFKRIALSPEGIHLRPLNPTFDIVFFSNKEIEELPVRVFGVAIEVRRKIL